MSSTNGMKEKRKIIHTKKIYSSEKRQEMTAEKLLDEIRNKIQATIRRHPK